MIEAITASHPAPDLHLPQYYTTEPLKRYVDVLRLITSCPIIDALPMMIVWILTPPRLHPISTWTWVYSNNYARSSLRTPWPCFFSSTEPISATYILSTLKSMGSLPKKEDEIDALLSTFIQLKRGQLRMWSHIPRVSKNQPLFFGVLSMPLMSMSWMSNVVGVLAYAQTFPPSTTLFMSLVLHQKGGICLKAWSFWLLVLSIYLSLFTHNHNYNHHHPTCHRRHSKAMITPVIITPPSSGIPTHVETVPI